MQHFDYSEMGKNNSRYVYIDKYQNKIYLLVFLNSLIKNQLSFFRPINDILLNFRINSDLVATDFDQAFDASKADSTALSASSFVAHKTSPFIHMKIIYL